MRFYTSLAWFSRYYNNGTIVTIVYHIATIVYYNGIYSDNSTFQ